MRIAGTSLLALWLALASAPLQAAFPIAKEGVAGCSIVLQSGATEPEQMAAGELAGALNQITGGEFKIVKDDATPAGPAIIIGPGSLAAKYFPETDFKMLGAEELVMRSKGEKLLLAGGRPRGTVYAIDRFLQEQCGVRWWTPWASNFPPQRTLQLTNLELRENPAFEYRAPFWFTGFEPHWKVHNGANDAFSEIPKSLGGCIKYKGHAHTFYRLVPPAQYFGPHPEWFSLINGKRTTERAQLCLSNPELRDFVVGRVKEWLRESPEAEIVSVTQNDWAGWCQCPDCKALDEAEGSHSGTMLAFVNYVAEKIEPDFPRVAIDTFAYQYTRKPPKTLRAKENVIVRLCSIECNFREPLNHPSNAAFLEDLKAWSKICSRLYVWDYTTDFNNYVHPHPNWFTLGPNLRLFQKYGVKGVFEQGAYAGYGAEMAELRAWVLAQLLWNPQRDDRALIQEFLAGYYGKNAAGPISQYLDLMYAASKDVTLGCFLSKAPKPHLNFATLCQAELLWQQAEKAAAGDEEKFIRVRLGHLPVQYAFLKWWKPLWRECRDQNGKWPISDSRHDAAQTFRKMCEGSPGKEWTQVRVLSEHGIKVDDFVKQFEADPPKKDTSPIPKAAL
jgi:uncharacterized protein DUF4838